MKKVLIIVIMLVLICSGTAAWHYHSRPKTQVAPVQQSTPTPVPPTQPSTSLDKQQYSIDLPDSLWVVVNKKRPLPGGYVPSGLINYPLGGQMRPETAKALDMLVASAQKDGIKFKVISGYRSYANQQTTYNGYVSQSGQAAADTFSARPGHSEHQTGLAVDLGNTNGNCDLDTCFGDTATGKWLAAHAHEYGFIIRYQKDKQAIVGYQYEPWHIRFVGTDLSSELNKTGQTMEEFFGLPAAPDY